MKKFFILSMLSLFVFSVSLCAAGEVKRKNVLVGGGGAASDLEGPFMEIGVEKQLSGNFYGQLLFDYYFSPFELPGDSNPYALGISLYGVHKFPVSDSISFLLKAGFHLTVMKEYFGILGIETNADLGIAGGGGIEFNLSHRLAIYSGATVKRSLDESRTWFKFYGGVGFRVK